MLSKFYYINVFVCELIRNRFSVSVENRHHPDTMEMANNLASPRLLKSHMPASALPADVWKKRSKIIYVTRNVKDVLVSNFRFQTALGIYKGSIEDFVQCFLDDSLLNFPFWDHVLEFWKMRNEPNIYFTSYERLKNNMRTVIGELCQFLDKPVPSEEILSKMEQHLNFENMKSE